MSYILVEIDSGGYINAEKAYDYTSEYKTRVIHKETVGLHKAEGLRVFENLQAAKSEWSGPESDEAILNLDEAGAGANIWMAESQRERLTQRLKKWSGCYGGWPVKKLNT